VVKESENEATAGFTDVRTHLHLRERHKSHTRDFVFLVQATGIRCKLVQH
jgi:hypothetical protein